MGKVVTDGNIAIGYEYFKGVRKRPCICIKEGNVINILGTFKSEEDADFFVDKLAEMVSAKERSDSMGRLIDADVLVKVIDKHTNDDGALDDDITCILEEVPTSYDVEAVVKGIIAVHNKTCTEEIDCKGWNCDECFENRVRAIVRNGGKE